MTNQTKSKPQVEFMADTIATKPKDRPKVRLIYRGEIFEYTLPQIEIDARAEKFRQAKDRWNWPIIKLIYRGCVYERRLPPQTPYQKPRAINWRWR